MKDAGDHEEENGTSLCRLPEVSLVLQSEHAIMLIRNLTLAAVLAEPVSEARTFGSRLRGWAWTDPPGPGAGLYLTPCAWVHTFGMRFGVDAVHVDRSGRVLSVRSLTPGRLGPRVAGAAGVLELPAGACSGRCRVGDRLAQEGGSGW